MSDVSRVAIVGVGMMGCAVARDLLSSLPDVEVTLYDADEDALRQRAVSLGADRLRTSPLDATDAGAMARALAGHDVAVGALPHDLSLALVRAAIEAGTALVDLVGEAPEERRGLHGKALEAECLIVPGCGVAPGISNFCVGQGVSLLDETDSARIYVGGIPKEKEPPLFYQTVYSLESVFNAYARPAAIVRQGETIQVPPMSGSEAVEFPEPIGTLEAFFTDGLGSLPLTMSRRIRKELYEKTLRYPGHAERIQVLRDCGLLDLEPLVVEGRPVVPRRVLLSLLEDRLRLGPEGDWLVMRVVVEGLRSGRPWRHTFELVDSFDPATGETAMARTTGFTASAAAQAILRGELVEHGVFFPEELFVGERYEAMVGHLARRGVTLRHREEGI